MSIKMCTVLFFCYYIRLGTSGPIAGKTRLSTGGGYLIPHPPLTKVWVMMVMLT